MTSSFLPRSVALASDTRYGALAGPGVVGDATPSGRTSPIGWGSSLVSVRGGSTIARLRSASGSRR